jgi:RecA-family ATPase
MASQNQEILSRPEKGYAALDPSLNALKKNLDPHNYKKTEFIGGIFPVGSVAVVAGAPGVGKSTLVLKLICDLSLGGEILDGYISNQKPAKVLVFNGELPMDSINERLDKISLKYKDENIIFISAIEAHKNSIPMELTSNNGKDNISKIINDIKPDLIVFDSLMNFNLGDENTQYSMYPLFSELLRLADQYRAAIVVVHHTRKKSFKELNCKNDIHMDDVIGSSIITRASAVVLGLNEVELDDGEDWPYVQTLKSWFAPIEPFAFKRVKGTSANSLEELVFNFCPRFNSPNKKENILGIIRDLLSTKGTFTRAEVESRCKGSRTLVLGCLSQLVKEKKLKTTGTGKDIFYGPR